MCVYVCVSSCPVVVFSSVAQIFPACVHKNYICLAHFHMLLRNQIIGAPVCERGKGLYTYTNVRECVCACVWVCAWVYYENATNYSRIKVIINFPQTLFWQSFWNLCAHSCKLNPPPPPRVLPTHHSWRSFSVAFSCFLPRLWLLRVHQSCGRF